VVREDYLEHLPEAVVHKDRADLQAVGIGLDPAVVDTVDNPVAGIGPGPAVVDTADNTRDP